MSYLLYFDLFYWSIDLLLKLDILKTSTRWYVLAVYILIYFPIYPYNKLKAKNQT